MSKRLVISLLLGALLGVFCIVGASLRMPGELNAVYLISFWFNRLLMGLVIGLLTRPRDIKVALLRGIFFGAFVSFAFYSATEFYDFMGFMAGVIYGIIIEIVLYNVVKDANV